MRYQILLVDVEDGRFEILAKVADPVVVAKIKESVAGALPKPAQPPGVAPEEKRFFIPLPERRGPKGKRVIVTKVEEGSEFESVLKRGDPFDNASALSMILRYPYNACSQSLNAARRMKEIDSSKESVATLKGVYFMYEEDFHESLLEGVHD